MAVSINGKKEDVQSQPGSYVTLKREWKDGDEVEVRLPMSLRLEALPDDPNTVALLYGPIVLAGELGTEGMPNPYARGQCDLNATPTPAAPVFLADVKEVLGRVEPVAGKPLTFQTKGLGKPRDVSLLPFYRMHHQRYSVYWKVFTEEMWKKREAELAAAEARRKALEARSVDGVRIGEQQPETDHNMKGENTQAGEHAGRRWRHAPNGWFSYDLKVQPDQPLVLLCTYWGSDSGPRTFDVLVDGQKLATQTLANNKPGEFFDVEHPLPAELLKGKEKVTVRFQAHANNTAGGVFGCAILKAAK